MAGRRRGILTDSRPLLLPGLTSRVVSLVAHDLVIWAQSRGQLATVTSLREVSIVVGAVIGAVSFHERLGAVRVVGAVIVLTGVVLLATG